MQFDLYENPASAMRRGVPFVVVLSSHLLTGLTEVIAAPVLAGRTVSPPDFEIPIVIDELPLVISLSGWPAFEPRI